MGWLRRLLGLSKRDAKSHPWISPQFLSIVAGLGVVAVSGFVFLRGDSDGSGSGATGGGDGAYGQTRREFVGLDPGVRIPLAPGVSVCDQACHVEELWSDWLDNHPSAAVISREPEYENGQLHGYWVEYTEGQP